MSAKVVVMTIVLCAFWIGMGLGVIYGKELGHRQVAGGAVKCEILRQYDGTTDWQCEAEGDANE